MVRDFRELIFVSVLLKPLKQPGLHGCNSAMDFVLMSSIIMLNTMPQSPNPKMAAVELAYDVDTVTRERELVIKSS